MFLIIIAAAVALLWFKTSHATPASYPEFDADKVIEWKLQRLILCRRFAGLLAIYILLAIANGALKHYAFTHPELHPAFICLTTFNALYLIGFIIYASVSLYKNRL